MYKMLIKLMDVKYNPKMRNKIAGLSSRTTAVIYNVNLISQNDRQRKVKHESNTSKDIWTKRTTHAIELEQRSRA